MKIYFRFCSLLLLSICFCTVSNAQTFKRTQTNGGGKIAPPKVIAPVQLSDQDALYDTKSMLDKRLVSYLVFDSSGNVIAHQENQIISSDELIQLKINLRMKDYTLRIY